MKCFVQIAHLFHELRSSVEEVAEALRLHDLVDVGLCELRLLDALLRLFGPLLVLLRMRLLVLLVLQHVLRRDGVLQVLDGLLDIYGLNRGGR